MLGPFLTHQSIPSLKMRSYLVQNYQILKRRTESTGSSVMFSPADRMFLSRRSLPVNGIKMKIELG